MWVCNPPTPFKFCLRQSTSARGTKSLLRERSRYRLNSGGACCVKAAETSLPGSAARRSPLQHAPAGFVYTAPRERMLTRNECRTGLGDDHLHRRTVERFQPLSRQNLADWPLGEALPIRWRRTPSVTTGAGGCGSLRSRGTTNSARYIKPISRTAPGRSACAGSRWCRRRSRKAWRRATAAPSGSR
jgi:hypothetical protein